jgi:hypothetical protein
MLALEAPGSKTAVPDAIEALKAKKQWYSEQPRGTVPKVSQCVAVTAISVTICHTEVVLMILWLVRSRSMR